ncbi:MAG: hypothetical protein O3A09_04615 [Bacteroidetes bacterium]|nr:hypothetical protein [Bacteroidota bacterium]
METQNLEAVEKKSNLVKAEAYQVRSDLEEMIATIDAISATVFLGDRQLANQITGLLTQQIDLAAKDITTEENIIGGLEHNSRIRAKLLEHRCYLNAMLVEINSILLGIAEKRNAINEMRVSANLVTARLNSELSEELKRIKGEKSFMGFAEGLGDSRSLDALYVEKERQNNEHLDALADVNKAKLDLRKKVAKAKTEAVSAKKAIRGALPK